LKYDLEKTTLLNSQPHGITIVPSGSVWITETNAHMIRNLGANIVFPGIQFGAFGSGWDQLNQPKGIAADLQNDYIYVVDSQNNRIKKYLNGYTQQLIGSLGAGDNQFDSPYGIAVDSVGNVYVTDQNNKRVQKFQTNPNFAFIKNWLIGGAPRGIACDPDINRDSVYVVDSDNREVRPYSLDGGPKTPWSIAGNPFGIAVDKWGFVYVIDAQGDRFLKFTPTGTLCYEKGGLFNNPIDICVDGYGYVLITNVGNSQIIRLK
jgi:tripartite motif-containing protein 71